MTRYEFKWQWTDAGIGYTYALATDATTIDEAMRRIRTRLLEEDDADLPWFLHAANRNLEGVWYTVWVGDSAIWAEKGVSPQTWHTEEG